MSANATIAAPSSVIMQPTTLCNLDCGYCYLPERAHRRVMFPTVAKAVATSIESWTIGGSVELCWHGGEPLTVGLPYFRRLTSYFAGLDVVHSLQTNATLINEEWCAFLAEQECRVGVSIDGTRGDNGQRVDRAGKEGFDRIVRGIRLLVDHGFAVSVIAVVSNPAPGRARRLYEFVAELGCTWLGVNIEEKEGVNERNVSASVEQTEGFWTELVQTWRANPALRLREVDRVLMFAQEVLTSSAANAPLIDPLPTVGWNGDVTLISPELAGFTSGRLGEFSCGNVLRTPLDQLVTAGMAAEWVLEHRQGVKECASKCSYFDFCGGGHPSNRYFEHGRLDVMETDYCRRSKQALMEGVIAVVDNGIVKTSGH